MTFPNTAWQTRVLLLTGFAICGVVHSTMAEDRSPSRKSLDFRFETPWADAEPESLPKTTPLDELTESGHRHAPVDIEARPIVERYKVNLNRPRRVIQDPDGAILIADWADGTVVKVDAEGDAILLASELNEPAGLALDASGNVFVANHGGGMTQQGNIVKISPGGELLLFAEDLNGPTALAFDARGDLYVTEFHGNRILRITPSGIVHLFVDNIPAPAALAFDVNGYLYTASSTEGTVYRINPMGDVEILARGLSVPSDLTFDPQDHLIVTNFGGTELTYVDPTGSAKTFALVPKGTIGIQFDSEGNLFFVNWDFQTLMKVTTHLRIPCPHCEKTIPLRLRQQRQSRPKKPEPESDPETDEDEPII